MKILPFFAGDQLISPLQDDVHRRIACQKKGINIFIIEKTFVIIFIIIDLITPPLSPPRAQSR